MVLNIFPRRAQPATAPAPEPEAALPEPSPEVMEQLDGAAKRQTRRGSRGGRGRGRAGAAGTPAPDEETTAAFEAATPEPEPVTTPARAPRRTTRAKTVELEAAAEVAEEAAPVVSTDVATEAPRRPRRGSRQPQPETAARQEAAPAEAAPPAKPAGRGEPRERGGAPAGADSALVRAIEQQSRQIEQLIETVRRGGGSSGTSSAPPPRVGVFVDAANVELASDRLRARFDWAKILDLLTRDRQLVRAIAYSPVHDDPGVSIETQRFVEPFLGKGYKVVTKPLKRFQDGTIKANVDIEMALDVMEMLERLDIVCLISGDGDFQRLVEVVQSKGVRVEVVAVGNSAAGNLRNAADHFIDLQQRLREVRV